jgi:hypothetical protein
MADTFTDASVVMAGRVMSEVARLVTVPERTDVKAGRVRSELPPAVADAARLGNMKSRARSPELLWPVAVEVRAGIVIAEV